MDDADTFRVRIAGFSQSSPAWLSSWVLLSLVVGVGILLVRLRWPAPPLDERVIRGAILYIAVPLGLGIAFRRNIGWSIDRRAIADSLLLAAFVAPFYVVGSSLPTVRVYYPMWSTAPAFDTFLPHAIQLFALVLATETYYRGLLCVGVREIGPKCVFISPVVYVLVHLGKPPVELLLAGPADILFGAADYRSGSILPSTVAHGSGLVLLDWLVLHDPILPPEQVVRWLEWLPVPL